ncbi:MAG: mycothiol synthase [Streptosporangiales bacterium]|nr:mycothiol synthase [Streptosporangiales bacterium]
MPVTENADRLTPAQVATVEAITRSAAETDGTYPLAEQFQLRIAAADGEVRHLLGYLGDELVGYAQLDLGDPAGAAAEVVVAPQARRRGVGTALVTAAHELDARLRVWAHGGLSAATALADHLGYRPVRSLWLMRRPLAGAEPLPEPPPVDGVEIRTFAPGTDEEAWLRANARAFASHPEQGRMTMADVLAREEASWFDPAGFFIAWRGDRLAGYHWTKVAEDGVGEVYVLGVDPDEQGTGLGKALLMHGLTHLRDRGLVEVTLYVEADNAPAVALYRKLGFAHAGTDTMYQQP